MLWRLEGLGLTHQPDANPRLDAAEPGHVVAQPLVPPPLERRELRQPARRLAEAHEEGGHLAPHLVRVRVRVRDRDRVRVGGRGRVRVRDRVRDRVRVRVRDRVRVRIS